ncbi:MAG: transglycosylase SLT domain-containing protein [Deltaproteobacteria bacterium]|nr:transglycosylase SLT domain-containing protein [Deltaproteobacteria bacterium]
MDRDIELAGPAEALPEGLPEALPLQGSTADPAQPGLTLLPGPEETLEPAAPPGAAEPSSPPAATEPAEPPGQPYAQEPLPSATPAGTGAAPAPGGRPLPPSAVPGYLVSVWPGAPGTSLRGPLPGRPFAVFFDGPVPAGASSRDIEAEEVGAEGSAPAPSLFGRRLDAYERAAGLIREERYSEALAFLRRSPRDVRDWEGIMSLEAALLTREDPWAALQLYDRILGSDNRGVHWARALSGYKFLLNDLRAEGDHVALFRLVKCLAFEWRNRDARELVREALADPGLPDTLREELSQLSAVLAMRHGDFAAAEDYFAHRAEDRTSLRWLSTLRARQGDFRGAAAARRAAAETLKGRPRLREEQRVLELLTKGGLADEAQAMLDGNPELRSSVPAWAYFLGLARLVANDPEKALELFEGESREKGERGQRALYFKGRALEALLRHPEAAEAYEAAAAGIYGYYGLMAKGRLARLHGARPGPYAAAERMARLLQSPTGEDRDSMGFFLWITERVPWPLPPAGRGYRQRGATGDPARARASAFRHHWRGDFASAVMELRQSPGAVPRRGEVGSEERAHLLALVADARDYGLATEILGGFPLEGRPPPPPLRWNHPPAFGREALHAWRRWGVPPQLTLAVIRTESAFRSDAVSASNARGLMQILPSTAERIAGLLGEKAPRDEDLFDPALNIRYGTSYLGMLLDSFGSVPLALAAYNGGPFNMASLLSAREGLALDLFVETLPFAETSAYVRRAVESKYAYEEAYLGAGVLPDLGVPVRIPERKPPDF